MKLLQMKIALKLSCFLILIVWQLTIQMEEALGMYTYNVQADFTRPVKFKYNENLLQHSAASVWNSVFGVVLQIWIPI